MPYMYILIGVTGSGKSTWVKNSVGKASCSIVCKDQLRYELKRGQYIFDPDIEPIIHKHIVSATELICYRGEDHIFIDETNLTKQTRKIYIDIAKKYGYKIVGVVFPILSIDEYVKRRKQDDFRGYTENDWRYIAEGMINRYEKPELCEGFDELVFLPNN